MTEDDWVGAEAFNVRYTIARMGARRARLFAAAVCRALGQWIDHPAAHTALDAVERFADKGETTDTLWRARQAVAQARGDLLSAAAGSPGPFNPGAVFALWVVEAAASEEAIPDIVERAVQTLMTAERLSQDAALRRLYGPYREIVGNPLGPVTFARAWRTSTAVAIARGMYGSRDFSAMPILADALQDAGCDNEDVLTHCRDPQAVHVRGCWVVDLVLGKV